MKLLKIINLTDSQKDAIIDLENFSFPLDKLESHAFLSNDINFDRTIPFFYLCYEDDKLVAFLTTFMPTNGEAEIVALTHPNYRKKGYFKRLFIEAKNNLAKLDINKLVFAIESNSSSGKSVLKKYNDVKYERTEYRMFMLPKKINYNYENLIFEKVNNKNKIIYSDVVQVAFPDLENNENYVDTIISSDTREAFIAFNDGLPVGSFSINYENGDAFFYGACIIPSQRGRGFGKELITYAIKEGLKGSSKIVLDVDSNNPVAFHIYKQSSFQIDFSIDYYSINTSL